MPRHRPTSESMPEDGIEIHYDDARGCLELACQPDAFAPYRALARDQLKDFPAIPIDKVIEINIVDTATFVARRKSSGSRIGGFLVLAVCLGILILAAIGAKTLISNFFA